MKIHNFIISSTRPELLNKQIASFVKIRNGRKLNFYVFNDGDNKNKEFSIEIIRLKQLIPDINVYYFSLDEQIKIIENVASKYSRKVNINREHIIGCFKEREKMNGIRSIQNKSVLIFYLNNKDEGSIIHKLDDDIFPYEADRQNNVVKIVLKQDFFEKKEISIGDRKVISGSNYTIDSPSPLVNYIDFTEFLFNFYNIAKDKPENTRIGKDILKISPSKVRMVVDSSNILDILPIDEETTYKEANDSLEKYAKMIENGNSRIIINDNKENQNGTNNFFPGGCVSFMYENLPTLTPSFGNQDLLWELFEILDGKKLITNSYIGHIKSSYGRPSIMNDLKDSSYKHQTSVTYSVFSYLTVRNGKIPGLLNFQSNFIDPMNKWLDESRHYSVKIMEKLGDENNWYARKTRSTTLIKKICSEFLNYFPEIKANFSHSTDNIDALMSGYYKKKEIFDKLLKLITTTAENNKEISA